MIMRKMICNNIAVLFICVLSSFVHAGTWEKITSSGAPSARANHVAVYNEDSKEMVVFGEHDSLDSFVYVLDLVMNSWSIPVTTGPSLRTGHAAIVDTSQKRMIIFGGKSGSTYLNDVWEWNLSQKEWSALSSTGTAPAARINHTAIYDSLRDRMIIFGGNSGSGTNFYNDVSILDLTKSPAEWSALSTGGNVPVGRIGHSAIYDTANDTMVVYGGLTGSSVVNEVYSLDLATNLWTKVTTTGDVPAGSMKHTTVYDSDTQKMILFGGTDLFSYMDKAYTFDLSSNEFEEIYPGGSQPDQRARHSAIYDKTNKRMIIFAGYDGGAYLRDIYALYLSDIWPPGFASDNVFNYPNPFSAGTESTHIMVNLTENTQVSIKIFSLIGEQVKVWTVNGTEGVNDISWDGTNGDGRLVESGGYICFIEKKYRSGTSSSKFKIAVLK